jgi:hypothetical protein
MHSPLEHSISHSCRSPRWRNAKLTVIVALVGLVASCSRLPNAPTVQSPIVSGHVYQTATPGFGTPLLSRVLITINQADGSQRTALTDGEGYYTLTAMAGFIAISAVKAGYETNRAQFDLSRDTVLNFSLTEDLIRDPRGDSWHH